MRDIAQALPSFWLVQASHLALGEQGWGPRGWLVVAGWTALLSALAAYAYRRDTSRA
jgi:ABC-2 type transport system permease protein